MGRPVGGAGSLAFAAALALLGAVRAHAQDGFDLDLVDVEAPPWWELHGRSNVSLAWVESDDERNVDGLEDVDLTLSSVAVFGLVRLPADLRIEAELELEGDGEVSLDLAALRWQPFAKLLTVSAGIDYVPFGVERLRYASPRNPLVDRPAPFREVWPGTYSDLGLFVSGEAGFASGVTLLYEAAVVTGLRGPERDDRPSLETNPLHDNNPDKSISGRLGIRWLEWLEVGGSGYVGRHDRSGHHTMSFLGADVRFEAAGFRAIAEVVHGRVELPDEGGSFERWGYYVLVSYRWSELGIIESVEVSARVDGIDADSRVRDHLDVDRVALGVVVAPIPHFYVKVEAEMSIERYDAEANDALLFEVGCAF